MSFDVDRLCWSLRQGAVGDYANGVFSDLADKCREICDEHFPREDGFEVRRTWLSGPIEGINLTVERGEFRGQISVQRYLRLRGVTDANDCAYEIRVVAAARRQCTALCPVPSKNPGIGPVAGLTFGASVLAIFALAGAGVLSTWSQAVLMLPVLLGLRMYWASRIAANLRHQAQHHPALPQASTEALTRTDAQRWRSALSELEAQREALAERFTLRPFRSIPTTPALPQAEQDAPLRSVG
jgi:hypothetical protein